MSNPSRSIFRNDAITRYAEARQADVLPRLIQPRYFLFQWALALLLGAATLTAWLTPVPLWARGSGLLQPHPDGQHVQATLFLPAAASSVQGGQAITLTLANGQRVNATVLQVEPTPVSPAAVRTRFGPLAQVSTPVFVLTTTFPATALVGAASTYAGAPVVGDVQTGTRRLLTFLPGLSWLMEHD